jgi:hypothetical protein
MPVLPAQPDDWRTVLLGDTRGRLDSGASILGARLLHESDDELEAVLALIERALADLRRLHVEQGRA